MKKLLALILVAVLLVPAAALSDVDLSGMTFDELVALREQLNLAIWNSQEWQEVTVPIGVWKIGEDIPEGHWTITVPADCSETWGRVTYCDKLDETEKNASYDGSIFYSSMINRADVQDDDSPKMIDIDCKSGNYIIIEYCSMSFSPFTGKPDLGFK